MVGGGTVFSGDKVFRQDSGLLQVGRCLESGGCPSVPSINREAEGRVLGIYKNAAECLTITGTRVGIVIKQAPLTLGKSTKHL